MMRNALLRASQTRRVPSTPLRGAPALAEVSPSTETSQLSQLTQQGPTMPAAMANPMVQPDHFKCLEARFPAFAKAMKEMDASAKATRAVSKWTQPDTYEATRLPANEAMTLPGVVYHSDEFFQIEKERIFAKSWVSVCHVSQVRNHGQCFPVKVGDQPLFIANDRGNIKAFQNVCRHRGATLVDRPCKQNVIVCPYHRWGYALDGRLVGTPLFDDGSVRGNKATNVYSDEVKKMYDMSHVKDFERANMNLFDLRVDTWQGMVFVNVDGNAPPLKEYLGDLVPLFENYNLDKLAVVGEGSIDAGANWKALQENFLEYYHLPSVHPALCAVSGVNEHIRVQGTGCYMAFKTFPLGDGSAAGEEGTPLDPSRAPHHHGISVDEAKTAFHVAIFPNTFFSIYPSHAFQVNMEPISPGLTRERAVLLANPELAGPEWKDHHSKVWDFFQNVNNEDIDIVARVQEGTKSSQYMGGRFSFRFEEPLHRFQNMVIDHMVGEPSVPLGDDDASNAGLSQGAGAPPTKTEEPLHRFQNMVIDHMVGEPSVPLVDDDARITGLSNGAGAPPTKIEDMQ